MRKISVASAKGRPVRPTPPDVDPVPATPADVRAVYDAPVVTVSWEHDGQYATHIEVERKAGGGAFTPLVTTSVFPGYTTDTQTVQGQTYTYRVRAVGTQPSAWAQTGAVAVPLPPPDPDPEPPPPATHTVGTWAQAKALTGVAVGQTVYVTERATLYTVRNESALAYKLIDDLTVGIFNEDRATVSTSGHSTALGTATTYVQRLQTDIVLGTLTLNAGTSLPVSDIRLHGYRHSYDSSQNPHIRLVRHEDGGFSDFSSRLRGVLEAGGGTTFTATYHRATGPRRLVAEGLTVLPANWSGIVPNDPNVNNRDWINWLHRIAALHPTAKTVDYPQTYWRWGTIEVPSGVILRGRADRWTFAVPDRRAFGPKTTVQEPGTWDKRDVDLDVGNRDSVYGVDLWDNGGFIDFRSFSNSDNNRYEEANFSGTEHWNGDWMDGFNYGTNGRRRVPPNRKIFYDGLVEFAQTSTNIIVPGAAGRGDWVPLSADARLLVGQARGRQHHACYGLDGDFELVELYGNGADAIFHDGGQDIQRLVMRDPRPFPVWTGGTKEIVQYRFSRSQHHPWHRGRSYVGEIDFVIGHEYGVAVVMGKATLDWCENGGQVLTDKGLTLVGGGTATIDGSVGPSDPAKWLVLGFTGGAREWQLFRAGTWRSRVRRHRGIYVPPTPGYTNTGSSRAMELSWDPSGVVTFTLERVKQLGGECGGVARLPESVDGAGIDVVLDGETEFRTGTSGAQIAPSTTGTLAAYGTPAALARVRYCLLPGAKVRFHRSGEHHQVYERVLRARGASDMVTGRVTDQTGVHTVTSAQNGLSTIDIPTNLMWGAREVSAQVTQGTRAVTNAEYRSAGGVLYAPPAGSTDFGAGVLRVTFSGPISTGNQITWAARMTPLAEFGGATPLARPFPTPQPIPYVTPGQVGQVDLAPFWEVRDFEGNAGAHGVVEHRVTKLAGPAAVSVQGSTLTYSGAQTGASTLEVVAKDAQGTESLQRSAVIVRPAVMPDPKAISGLRVLSAVDVGLYADEAMGVVARPGDIVLRWRDQSAHGNHWWVDPDEDSGPLVAMGDTFELRRDGRDRLFNDHVINPASATVVVLARTPQDRNMILSAQFNEDVGQGDHYYYSLGQESGLTPNEPVIAVRTNSTARTSTLVVPAGQNNVYAFILNGSTQTYRVNGGGTTTTTGSATRSAPPVLMSPSYRPWDGGVSAIAIYDRALSLSEVATVEAWAALMGGLPAEN
jgi:hypothetical protein